MKLILGTAQFGNGYGIKNNFKKIKLDKIIKILDLSKKKGIRYLDTAVSYNFINRIKSKYNFSEFKIINKISYKDTSNLNDLKKRLFEDLENLKINNYFCVHLHQPFLYNDKELKKIYNFLNKLKDQNVIENLGLSIYNPDQYYSYSKNFKPDIIQSSLNVFDRRVISSGLNDYLFKIGVKLHIRSIFLQGLLLMNKKNDYFSKWDKEFKLLDHYANKSKLSKYQYLINFVKQQKNIDSIIFGVDNINQLNKTISSFELPKVNIPAKLTVNDELIVDPTKWKI